MFNCSGKTANSHERVNGGNASRGAKTINTKKLLQLHSSSSGKISVGPCQTDLFLKFTAPATKKLGTKGGGGAGLRKTNCTVAGLIFGHIFGIIFYTTALPKDVMKDARFYPTGESH